MLIFSGLAISDMIASLHGLLLHRRRVKWDWLALAAALYILLVIINSWGITFRAFNRAEEQLQLWSFVLVLCQVIPLYLAARASIPDQVVEGTNLREYYTFISRYLWTSLAISFALYLLIAFRRGAFLENLESEWTAAVQLGLMLVMIAFPQRSLHKIIVPLMFVFFSIGHLTKPLFE